MFDSIVPITLVLFVFLYFYKKWSKVFDDHYYTRDSLYPVYPRKNLIEAKDRIFKYHGEWAKECLKDKRDENKIKEIEEKWNIAQKQYNFMIQTNIDVINGKILLDSVDEPEYMLKNDIS